MSAITPTIYIPLVTAVMLFISGLKTLEDRHTILAGKVMILASILVIIVGLSRHMHGILSYQALPLLTEAQVQNSLSIGLMLLSALTLLALLQTRYKHRFSIVLWGFTLAGRIDCALKSDAIMPRTHTISFSKV